MAERGVRKTRVGRVVSNGMNKSVIVEVTRTVKHPLYKKYVQRNARLMAHDERDECQVGDKIRIIETRPLSKRKRWRVQEKIA